MKTVTVGQIVEYNGRQGFISSLYDRHQCCVWFLCPPNWAKGRYCFIDTKKLQAKPKIKPLRLNGQIK